MKIHINSANGPLAKKLRISPIDKLAKLRKEIPNKIPVA
jgi:hypothetical protein